MVAVVLLPSDAGARAQPATPLQSFYVQSQIEGGQQIVEVSQQGHDVRVRTIQVVSVDAECPGLVVPEQTTSWCLIPPCRPWPARRSAASRSDASRNPSARVATTSCAHDRLVRLARFPVASCGGRARRFPSCRSRATGSTRPRSCGEIPTSTGSGLSPWPQPKASSVRGTAEQPDQQTREAFELGSCRT